MSPLPYVAYVGGCSKLEGAAYAIGQTLARYPCGGCGGGATLSECPMIQDQSIVMLDAIDKRRPTYAGSDLLDCRQRLMED